MIKGNFSLEGTDEFGKADGTTGHLMEQSSLLFMNRFCEHVKEILVVHIDPQEMYEQIGENQYRHTIRQDEVITLPKGGWRAFQKKKLRDAMVYGKADSKIIRRAA